MTIRELWESLIVGGTSIGTQTRYKVVGASTPPPGAVSVFAGDDGTPFVRPIASLVTLECWEAPVNSEGDPISALQGPYLMLSCFSFDIEKSECDIDFGAENWLGIAENGHSVTNADSRFVTMAQEHHMLRMARRGA